jgi:hypothetical protein
MLSSCAPITGLAALAVAAAIALPTQAAILEYEATLSGLQEVPPNASPGTGTAEVTIDTLLNTMRVQASFSGLLGLTTVAHIHCCALPGFNAPVATTTPTFPGFPAGVTAGTYDQIFDMTLASSYRAGFITDNGGTPATAFAALLTGLDAGEAYFNVHTAMFPGGEIRGQLSRVPEPASAALLLAALGLLAATRRRATVQPASWSARACAAAKSSAPL